MDELSLGKELVQKMILFTPTKESKTTRLGENSFSMSLPEFEIYTDCSYDEYMFLYTEKNLLGKWLKQMFSISNYVWNTMEKYITTTGRKNDFKIRLTPYDKQTPILTVGDVEFSLWTFSTVSKSEGMPLYNNYLTSVPDFVRGFEPTLENELKARRKLCVLEGSLEWIQTARNIFLAYEKYLQTALNDETQTITSEEIDKRASEIKKAEQEILDFLKKQ